MVVFEQGQLALLLIEVVYCHSWCTSFFDWVQVMSSAVRLAEVLVGLVDVGVRLRVRFAPCFGKQKELTYLP